MSAARQRGEAHLVCQVTRTEMTEGADYTRSSGATETHLVSVPPLLRVNPCSVRSVN
jgi:hypothetical protein